MVCQQATVFHRGAARLQAARGRCFPAAACLWASVWKMADPEVPATKPTCSFLFKKSTKKFAGRKRKASNSDKGTENTVQLVLK